MNPSLILSKDNLFKTSLDCDSLGIHYQVTSDFGLLRNAKKTYIRRLDKQSNEFVLVAEWEQHSFHSDVFNFPGTMGIEPVQVPVSSFLTSKKGFLKTERSFEGNDGQMYIWRATSGGLEAFISENGKEGELIAKFHSSHILINARKASIELFPGSENTLDSLVLTFLYTECRRRLQNTTNANAAAAAAASASS